MSNTKANPEPLEMALIALALADFSGEGHDIESGRITIRPYKTEWSSKRFGLTYRNF